MKEALRACRLTCSAIARPVASRSRTTLPLYTLLSMKMFAFTECRPQLAAEEGPSEVTPLVSRLSDTAEA